MACGQPKPSGTISAFLLKNLPFIILISLVAIINGCAVLAPISLATTGMVVVDERSVGNQVDDKLLNSKIKGIFSKGCVTDVNVSVMEGRALVVGNSVDLACVDSMKKEAWSLKGIKELITEIGNAPRTISEGAGDLLISNQVRAKFLVTKNIKSVNYSVSSNKGIVYILGIAQTQEELNAIETTASLVTGVKRVVNYAILKNDPRRWRSF